MRNLTHTFLLFIAALLLLSTPSCKKYEDGPRFSLRSKKARIDNTWKVDKAYTNGQEITGSEMDDYKAQFGVLELTKDGDVTSNSVLGVNKGTWKFSNNKKNIDISLSINYNGFPYTYTESYKILRLKNDELWLEFYDISSGDQKIVHFIPA